MTDNFRFLLLSAMYENGGNTTHRLLDGHPQMFVYPFESQLGTRLVSDMLTSVFPVKYRWPVFDLAAAPAEDYHAIIDEECKVRARTPEVSKFRDTPFDFSDDDSQSALRRASRGERALTSVQHGCVFPIDVRRMERLPPNRRAERCMSAIARSSIVDAEKIVNDLPGAHVLHVVRNPWSAYADTKKRPVPLSLASYLLGWTLNQYHALVYQRALSGPGSRFAARRHSRRSTRCYSGSSAAKLGLDAADALGTPSFNATALEHVYPWGTIRSATTDANRANGGGVERF